MRPLRRPAPAQALNWAFSVKVLTAAEQVRNHAEDNGKKGIPAQDWFKEGDFPTEWRGLKAELGSAQDGLCVWCTIKVRSGGSTGEVDHLRPKTMVRRALPDRSGRRAPVGRPSSERRPGYWWRTYDPENLALVCKICNTNKGPCWPVARRPDLSDWDDPAQWAAPDDGRVEYDVPLDPFEPSFDPANHFACGPRGVLVEAQGDLRAHVTIAMTRLDRDDLEAERRVAVQRLPSTLDALSLAIGSTTPKGVAVLNQQLENLATDCSWSSPHALYFRAALGSALSEPSAPFDWPTLRRLWDARDLAPGIDRLPTLI